MTYQPNYDFLTLTQQAQIKAGELRNALLDLAMEWAEKELQEGNYPYLRDFLDAYPEWDNEELHSTIKVGLEAMARWGD